MKNHTYIYIYIHMRPCSTFTQTTTIFFSEPTQLSNRSVTITTYSLKLTGCLPALPERDTVWQGSLGPVLLPTSSSSAPQPPSGDPSSCSEGAWRGENGGLHAEPASPPERLRSQRETNSSPNVPPEGILTHPPGHGLHAHESGNKACNPYWHVLRCCRQMQHVVDSHPTHLHRPATI